MEFQLENVLENFKLNYNRPTATWFKLEYKTLKLSKCEGEQ